VHVRDAARVALDQHDDVDAGVDRVPGVDAQPHGRIDVAHQAVDFVFELDERPGVRVERERESVLGGDRADRLHAREQPPPARVVEPWRGAGAAGGRGAPPVEPVDQHDARAARAGHRLARAACDVEQRRLVPCRQRLHHEAGGQLEPALREGRAQLLHVERVVAERSQLRAVEVGRRDLVEDPRPRRIGRPRRRLDAPAAGGGRELHAVAPLAVAAGSS
jgi:hypothetical protein